MFSLITRLLLISLSICFIQSYKLNVPKVLLPFHSSKLISFTLEAKSETESASSDEICFNWSSSRPDVVTITPIYTDSRSKCSNKAVVSAVSKHPQRLTSIIFAHETKTDKLIRCDVIVDQINQIRIKHTTTHLYLEDSPECFTAEALDDEGNTFSSIDGLAFEWRILNDDGGDSEQLAASVDSRNVLKISKFIDSEYEVSDSIKQLESVGLTGHKILIEGLKTGQANVQAKLVDPFYKSVLKSPLVRLLVVANLLLEPSYPVYLVPGAEIKYTVSLIKQHSVEKISLPGSQYYFESRNSSIADLAQGDKTQSVVVAKNLGTTDVVLIDRNMREEMLTRRNNNQVDQQLVVPPPSATIHVVTPDHLVFSIKNWRSWILEVGRRYEIVIQVVSTQRMQIYSSDNLVIESQFDAGKFGVNYQSSNGSYNYVAAREKGVTVARASLKGTRALLSGEIIQFDWVARGEQEIELLDPIDVIPKIVIFALKSSHLDSSRDQVLTSVSAYEYRLQASGGSGTYYWQSKNTTIASVSAQGLVRTTATKLGQTTVTVTDVRNTDIQSKSIIYVLEPVDLAIQACPVETQVGSKLYLNIQMNAYVPNSDQSDSTPTGSTIMPITDCSRLPFDVSILDESVFKFISIQSPTSTRSTDSSCAIVVLDSLRPGRTTIKLSYAGSHISDMLASNEIQIGSYSMLKSHKTLITLAKDSSLVLNLYDGPLFSSLSSSQAENAPGNVVGVAGYQSDVVVSDRQLLDVTTLESESHAQLNRYSYVVKCKGTSGDEGEASVSTVKFSLSHKKSPVNRCPLAFDYKLKVRCADPTSLELSQLFVNNEENTGNVLSTMKWKCPIKQSSHVATAHSQRPLFIQLTARDSLGNVFDNFTSLKTEWQIGDRALLDKASGSPSIESFEVAALDDSALMLLHPNEDVPNSNRLFYQRFQTKSAPIGSETKIALKMFITDEKVHTEEHHKHKHHHLSGTLNIRFVSDVRIEPETLTVFNHPSNIIPLGLSRGSGHYQAEIETALDTTLSSTPSSTPAAQQLSPALKINQINENSVVVSPSANNGLTYLNVYDYCVPPAMPKSLDDEDQGDQDARRRLPPSIHRNRVLTWPPYATAKIHVAGINSILVNYEDDKVQVKNGLKVYVQISDATGNLIRTKYFPLMNLRAKLANVESNAASNIPNSAVSGQQTSFQSQSKQDLSLATIELDQSSRSLIDEFTAVYVLNGLKKGVVSVQFEAQSDGYDSTTKRAAAASISSDNLIQSGIKDIQIYGPLRVQPKYIELIRGAQYQVLVSGGPVSLDATINYEVVVIEKRGANSKADAKIIDVDASKGLIDALELGKVKVVVKSIGHACQPFSAKAATQSPPPPSRCTPESKIVRVYSEDTLIVNVVELRSVQIHAPLRSIKRGNEMPVYLMANEKSLSALNFASSPSLKYHWRLNDPQIGELYHPLIEDALGTMTATSESDESYGLFEKAFSLRLLAKQSGSVKISVRVEFLNSKNQLTSLTDSIDIQVFDEAQFTHFAPSYFSFKHPLISKSSKSGTPTINTYQLLMSPGTQLQVRTNFDNLATKISYELKFYQASNLASGDDQTTSSSSSIICSNSTIRVNNEGLLIATGLKHLQIKNFQECTATLLVTVLMASGNGETKLSTSVATKQQTLAYTVRVKPVVYSMLKLNRNSIAKLTETVKFKLSRQSLIKNRLQLNSGGVQMKWHVRYYDNLGDTFDVVNTNNLYAVNRHDLVDFSNMNTNLFELTAQSYQQQQQAALNTDGTVPTTTSRDSVSESIAANDKSLSSISMVANAVENSFTLRTIERGMFIMELTPLAAKRSESSRDYIGLNIGSLNTDFETTSAGELDSIAGRSRIEANLGDLICLTRHDSSFQDENDDSSSKREHESETQWTSQVSNVVKLISSDPWTQIGVCVSSGHSNLRKSTAPPHDSLLGLVEVAVRPLERVRFLSRSVKHISNAQSTEVSNSIQFQVVGGSPASQNCSGEFENALKANSRQQEQFNPFKCSASLFTESGRRLAYLDRLLTPTVAFSGQYWFCEVKFVPESQVLMYDLIENHIDRPLAGKLSSSQLAEEFSRDNEPALIVIQIGSKSGEEIGGFDEDQSNSQQRAHSLPFVPAFFTTTKQIELLICGSRIGAPNRRIAGLSDSGSHDHVQLIIHATHSLRSHLILTSNCPTLIKIKEHDSGAASQQSKPAVSSSGASTSTTPLLSLTYEVSATDDVNDLNTFASLLQQLKGEIYVQVTCSLTQQIERIPVRFVFGAGLTTADAIRYSDFRSRTGTSTRSNYAYSFWYNPLGYILDLTPSQTSSFLVLLIVSLLTLLVVLRFWSPASSSTQQIAMNAQAAAAATAAAMISQQQRGSPKDHSSFNPYRYFSSSLDQVPNMDYNRSPSPHSFRRMPMSPQNANESYYATPRGGVFTGSPTKPPVERDSIRLFSTDANVFVRPRQPQDNTMNLSFRNNASRTYNDTSFSDHE